MSNLQTLIATISTKFAPVRTLRCEGLYKLKHRSRLLSRALGGSQHIAQRRGRSVQLDGWTGDREGVELWRHTVPSCIPIARIVYLSKQDSVIAFGIDEARRNLRQIKS
jgi:hypothetical protein